MYCLIRKPLNVLLFVLFVPFCILGQEYERYKTLLDTTIASESLGFDKAITVTVPFEWQKDVNRHFPLIIVFDQQNQRSHNYILSTIDYLTSNEQMPSAVIISVTSNQKYRYLETLHPESNIVGLAYQNEKFIFDELIPLAEKELKASTFRLLIGHSRYGYFTSSLLFSRIDQLNGVISLSPFFDQDNVNLVDSIPRLQKQQLNAYKYYRFGIGNDYPEDFVKMKAAIRALNNPKINAKGVLFKEAGHNVTPGLTIATALYDIFENWSSAQTKYISNAQRDLSIIDSLDSKILAHYGSKLEFSLGILNGKGWFFYNEKEYKKAIEAWQILLKSYPNFSEGYLYIADAQMQLKQDFSQSLEQFKHSFNESTIYSEEERNELLKELELMENNVDQNN